MCATHVPTCRPLSHGSRHAQCERCVPMRRIFLIELRCTNTTRERCVAMHHFFGVPMHHASREHCVATLHLYLSAVCTAPSVHVILMMASRSVARPGVCGYLRLSPGYLQGIFVHRGSPWSRLSPAISGYLRLSSFLHCFLVLFPWLSPAISGLSLGYLSDFWLYFGQMCFFAAA